MEEHFKIIAVRLWAEIRKDLCFFASCGFIVGLLTVWQYTLKERGVAHGESWPDALFSDFVSFNAFGFIFCGLLLIGSFATVMNALGCQWPRLESAVAHLENRFAQLTSVIISFTVGVSLSALIHAAFTVTVGGVALAVTIVCFNAFLIVWFFVPTLVARRAKPLDRWWASLLMLLLALGLVVWLVIWGVK